MHEGPSREAFPQGGYVRFRDDLNPILKSNLSHMFDLDQIYEIYERTTDEEGTRVWLGPPGLTPEQARTALDEAITGKILGNEPYGLRPISTHHLRPASRS